MSEFKAIYKGDTRYYYGVTSVMGNFVNCKFFISDYENTKGMVFCAAYNAARQSNNNKELCAFVGSMICTVYGGIKNSVLEALKGIGITPQEVKLPSQARNHNISENQDCEMDWPSILVNFGCCILHILKKFCDGPKDYKNFMSRCIDEMKERIGCDPDAKIDVLFDFKRANAIRTMIGSSTTLRHDLVRFLIYSINCNDKLSSVCHYLCNVLSWSEMRHLILMNDFFVKPKSPVLLDPRVSHEVDNLKEARAAITSHSHPQFFMYLASKVDLLKVEIARFPTLIAAAQRLNIGGNYNWITEANYKTVEDLVRLHRGR